jgi:DNA-binding PadR family transcriptional regulator
VGYLDILVLVALRDRPAHGYEIRQKVEWIHSGLVSLNPNVLYPALHRFEAMGALGKTVEPQQGRPPRHVYRLTERGEEVLHDLLADFGPAEAASDAEFKTRVAFFDLLDTEERLAILTAREAVLAAIIAQLGRFAERTSPGAWNETVRVQAAAQLEAERAWVAALRRRVLAEAGAGQAEVPRLPEETG